MALRSDIPEMYPYVGAEYLLQELLKLECFHWWNRVLQNIALLAAEDEDYATANRCLSEFKPIMKMVSRSYYRTDSGGGKLYDFKSELITSPTKEITFNKVQSIKMVKEIEHEFNAANFSRGSSQLSKERAKAAANYIEGKGISFIRIGHEGRGFSELKNKYGPTSEENCRIEIILM